MRKIKRITSIILAALMVMSLFIAVPMTASAVTRDDVLSLLSSMEAMIDDYYAQGDMDHAYTLMDYHDDLGDALDRASGQVTADVESAYDAAYTYFTENGGTVSDYQGGSGVSYPDVNNVYRATDAPVEVTIADLQPGDVLVTSPDPLEVQKGDCNIVLVGGTYGEGDVEEGTLGQTYLNNVTLGNDLHFHFSENYARIIDGDNFEHYDPVYNNSLGNAYIVLGNDNGTVYLAGYNFITYTITWKDYNGSNLYDGQSTVAAGTVPSYRWSVSRNSTAQYSYTFTGWTDSNDNFYSKDSDLPAVTQDETYTATYSQTLRSYTITWKDGDNKTLKSESVAYGTTPSYTGATPTKTEDDDNTYEFNNTWSPSVASVTGNATYTAQFTAVPKSAPATPKVAEVNGTQYETLEEALAAAPSGATVTLLEDIDYSTTYTVRNARDNGNEHAIDLRDLTLDLNGKTISTINATVVFGGDGAKITNGTFNLVPKNTDGSYKEGSYAVIIDNSVFNGYDETSTVDLEDVVCNGGVNVKGATTELKNVTASTTPTKFYTVWAETDATVTIKSGTYTDAQSGGKGVLATGKNAEGGAVINVKGGTFNATNNVVYTAEANSIKVSGGTFSKPVLEQYCADDYHPKDNGNGTYTVEINPFDYVTKDNDGYYFNDSVALGSGDTLAEANGYTSLFNLKILGVQKKPEQDTLSSDSGNDMRFVTVVNTDILKDADEYGYVFAKFDNKELARTHANEILVGAQNTIKRNCKETDNTISEGYGIYDTDTAYKYVTASVNGVDDGYAVAARFYVKKGDTYYYADYTNKNNETYNVCAAAYSDLA